MQYSTVKCLEKTVIQEIVYMVTNYTTDLDYVLKMKKYDENNKNMEIVTYSKNS